MGSTFQLFEKAEQLEAVCAGIYRGLASQFKDDPAARGLVQPLDAEGCASWLARAALHRPKDLRPATR